MQSTEIELHDRSKILLSWVRPGELLSVEIWKPGSLRDGHGWLLQGSTLLTGEVLKAIAALFLSGQDRDRAGALGIESH